MASSHKKRTGLRAALIVLLCLVLVCVVAAAVLYSFVSRKIKAFQSGASFALDYTITSTEAEPPALYALLEREAHLVEGDHTIATVDTTHDL